MHRQANFYKSMWPAGTTFGDGGTISAFYLPPAKAGDPKPMLGGGGGEVVELGQDGAVAQPVGRPEPGEIQRQRGPAAAGHAVERAPPGVGAVHVAVQEQERIRIEGLTFGYAALKPLLQGSYDVVQAIALLLDRANRRADPCRLVGHGARAAMSSRYASISGTERSARSK